MVSPIAVSLEDKPCLCGAVGQDNLLFTASDTLHGLSGKFDVVRCRTCGLIRTNPRPDQASMGFYYPDNYGPYLGTQIRSSSRLRRTLRFVYALLFSTHSQKIPKINPGRALEVGCASGSFLAKLTNDGWRVEGIEFSAKASQLARDAGFAVHTGGLEEIQLEDFKKYDLIVGWMVFEHLHDPIGALDKFSQWLADDGVLVLSVPDAAGGDFAAFQASGYALQVPTHLYHYTPQTLTALLARNGWHVERILHHRTVANWLAGLGIWLGSKSVLPGLAKYLRSFPERFDLLTMCLHPLAVILAAIGKTGRMTVWARKVRP